MITDCKAPDDGCCELCGLPQNTRDLIEAMKEGVAIRIAGLEATIERLRAIVDRLDEHRAKTWATCKKRIKHVGQDGFTIQLQSEVTLLDMIRGEAAEAAGEET